MAQFLRINSDGIFSDEEGHLVKLQDLELKLVELDVNGGTTNGYTNGRASVPFYEDFKKRATKLGLDYVLTHEMIVSNEAVDGYHHLAPPFCFVLINYYCRKS